MSEDNKINIRFNMKLTEHHYSTDAYEALKEFFDTMVTMLKEEPITLKKV